MQLQRLCNIWNRLDQQITILNKRRSALAWLLRHEQLGLALHDRAGILIRRQYRINKAYQNALNESRKSV